MRAMTVALTFVAVVGLIFTGIVRDDVGSWGEYVAGIALLWASINEASRF